MTQKALIIDDNEQCRALISEFFELYNYEVVSFPDPVTFFNLHRTNCCRNGTQPCFDLILTDNKMPGMSGIDFLEKIDRESCLLSESTRAIISGDWAEKDLQRAHQLDCRIFHKPDLSELFNWLENLNSDNAYTEQAV